MIISTITAAVQYVHITVLTKDVKFLVHPYPTGSSGHRVVSFLSFLPIECFYYRTTYIAFQYTYDARYLLIVDVWTGQDGVHLLQTFDTRHSYCVNLFKWVKILFY